MGLSKSQTSGHPYGCLTFARKAQEALEPGLPGRRPDVELASAWALIGQGWATLAAAWRDREPLHHPPGDS